MSEAKPVLEGPFEVYHDKFCICDINGHVCTAESPEIAQALVAALNGVAGALVAFDKFSKMASAQPEVSLTVQRSDSAWAAWKELCDAMGALKP